VSAEFFPLPPGLPAPVDDGAAAHLTDMQLPAIDLPTTGGTTTNLAALHRRWVIYVYPMTGRPGTPLPDGWDSIPGARGCTPQSCGFRDQHEDFAAMATGVLGLSSQATEYQQEAHDRLELSFPLVSDSGLQLKQLLRLPTFSVAGMELYKRITLVAMNGRIEKVFYPVFPPNRSAAEVLAWLRKQTG
jgi:peroxiredoxin